MSTMASSAGNEPRRGSRASLRHSTFIDPQTGARLNRTFTLHTFDGGSDGHTRSEPSGRPSPFASQPDPGPKDRYTITALREASKNKANDVRRFVTSDVGKGMFKCALAYLLGSLATFLPFLSDLFGRNDSKHLVATITVYFHPARSLGSMLDAIILAMAAFLYVALVSLISMSVAAFFADTVHLIELGHAIVLIFFIGGGLGFVAWVKLKRGNALVNISCSLTSLALITILTKEGAVQAGDYSFLKIAQILKMIIAGVIATMLVSFLVFPISARQKLKQNMIDVTDSLADMLALITSSFLSGDEAELEDPVLSRASERHKKAFAALTQTLKESKYEHYFLGTERQSHIETRLAHCIQRITQSVGGLRSAAAMQFVVVKPPGPMSNLQQRPNLTSIGSIASSPVWNLNKQLMYFDDGSDATKSPKGNPTGSSDSPSSQLAQNSFRTPAQIFELFIDHLGPSMRSLAFTLKEILDDLPYDKDAGYTISINPKFRGSLDRAIELYKQARTDALGAVYDKKDMSRTRPAQVQADWEEAAACCGHFSFSLLEVAEDVKTYLLILDQLELELEEYSARRTWDWLKFWQGHESHDGLLGDPDSDYAALLDKVDDLHLHFTKPDPRPPQVEPPKNNVEAAKARIKQSFFSSLYRSLSFLRREDIKFSIKVGFGAMLYALPSFIPSTRPFYSHWRGEWGLLSYMLVCSMTIGAANTTGYSRILGTCLGAVLAIAAWEVSNDNPFVLAALGFCMAYWTAYIIIGMGKGPMGRFIMLTYNLSALYAYSLSVLDDYDDDDGDEEDKARNPLILPIVGHRVAAVISGCIWGLIITRFVWPISARQKLKDGLSLIWLRMGLIWKRDPLSILIEGEHANQYMNLREEFDLQRFLSQLQGLVDASKNEFELRGPFPQLIYGRILRSTARMLDAFHEMNVVILKDLQASPGEEALLRATSSERTQLCSRISHLFGVLASSMKLEYPIIANDALPSIEHTRDRLLAKIFAYRMEHAHATADDDLNEGGTTATTKDEDFGVLYIYALVTGQLGLEIQNVLKEVENLFGTLDEEALRLQ